MIRLSLAALAAVLALISAMPAQAQAQVPEKRQIILGVDGMTAVSNLPLRIARRLGHFKEQGLNVTINDFRAGTLSMHALAGDLVDVVTGPYEHTIRMQAKGRDARAVIELGRFPGIVLGIRKDRAYVYKSPADLKGMKIAVLASGFSTSFFVMHLMAKAGLKPTDASFIDVGSAHPFIGPFARDDIDAISDVDPRMTRLDLEDQIRVVADSRTEEGTRSIFGGSSPSAVLYTKQDFIDRNPNTVQALVNAFYKTLKWLELATPEQISATLREDYRIVKANRAVYSVAGIIPAAGMRSASDILVAFDDELKDAKIDLARTFDDRFVKKATGM